jgi:hypothetical protein
MGLMLRRRPALAAVVMDAQIQIDVAGERETGCMYAWLLPW